MKSGDQISRPLKTHAETVLYFIQRLDIEMIDDLLKDDRTYQEMSKKVFLDKLDNAFQEFLDGGDSFLKMYGGYCSCEECNYKSCGYCFIGNHSKNYFNLIVEIENDEIKDIYECRQFRCDKSRAIKKKRICIYKYSLE